MGEIQTKLFDYGQQEMAYLKESDPVLGRAIERLGQVERLIMPDMFTSLVYAVIAQLISARAADTIWGRMRGRLGEISPASLAAHGEEAIRGCGLTKRKAGSLAAIAGSLAQGEWSMEELRSLPDEEAIARLVRLPGIGRWTAEMILLHGLERPDIVSWGDAAIRRGMMKLYGLPALTNEQFEHYRSRYRPFGSVASIYLWAIASE